MVELELLNGSGGNEGACTGTAISSTAVLTAAHCLTAGVESVNVITAFGAIPSASIHPVASYRDEDPASLDVGVVVTSQSLGLPTFPILIG